MLNYPKTVLCFLCLWMYRYAIGENLFPEIIVNPPDHLYFNKYGHCSVSMNRLRDAYFVEGELAESILKGYEYLAYNKNDKKNAGDYKELDNDIKKNLNLIIAAREKENSTNTPTNHPVNALHFLRRIAIQFNPILNKIFMSTTLIKRNFYRDLSALIDKHIREECFCWPTVSDIQITLTSLARITKVYQLSKTDLVKGIIMGHKSIEPLQLDEMIALTQESRRNNYHADVLEWTELLLKEPSLKDKESSSQLRNVIRMRANAIFESNMKDEAINYLEKSIKDNKFDTTLLKRDLRYFKSKQIDEKFKEKESKEKIHDSLCRESHGLSEPNNLKCFYRRIRQGWDRAKIEILNTNPPIYKYHNVVNDEYIHEIFNLVKTTKYKLNQYQQKGEVLTDSKYSKEETVFWDEDHDTMMYLSKKIAYVTGLHTNNHKYNTRLSSSAPFKVINYGVGGFEELKMDYLAKEDSKMNKDISIFGGDRLATWIYQLTDKIEGGRIVFPKVNISISLEQGSGLLWFNLMKNGTVNPLSEHLECPVIFGSKWISKKFIHENGNMFTRKCYRKGRLFF